MVAFSPSRLDEEGRYGRSSRNVGRDAVDATMSCAHEVAGRGQTRERSREARETSGIVADGEVVWSWHPLLMSSRAEVTSAQPGADETFQSAWRRWQKEFVTGESAKEPVKTIAWGMPDVSGASAVNTRAHTYYQ